MTVRPLASTAAVMRFLGRPDARDSRPPGALQHEARASMKPCAMRASAPMASRPRMCRSSRRLPMASPTGRATGPSRTAEQRPRTLTTPACATPARRAPPGRARAGVDLPGLRTDPLHPGPEGPHDLDHHRRREDGGCCGRRRRPARMAAASCFSPNSWSPRRPDYHPRADRRADGSVRRSTPSCSANCTTGS